MCGRTIQKTPLGEIRVLFETVNPIPNAAPNYNATPTPCPSSGSTERDGARSTWCAGAWCLGGRWMGARCINAMAETVATKPAFRDAFNRSQRCLVPVDGFYEWQKRPGGKQPYAIVGADGKPLALAGLWDRWREPGSGQPVQSSNLRWSDRLARELAGTAADARRCRAY
jgi:putative SOS response-associated peptidase YedK